MTIATDTFGRQLRDLRISVTDKCNFRCRYCMPSEQFGFRYKFLPDSKLLSFDEIFRLAHIFAGLGVTKLRLTGGEPLLRTNLNQLVQRLTSIDGLQDIALTTNGFLLPQQALALKKAGLKRLNISLDALDDAIFRQQSGTKHSSTAVLAGLEAAQAVGFNNIKINTVVKRGVNESEILPLAEQFRKTGVTLRFIEFMDVGTLNEWALATTVPASEIIAKIEAHYELEPVAPSYNGEVAKLYRYTDGAGYVGFVTSISQPFCRNCIRARLTADGQLVTCLFGTTGTDLRSLIRAGVSDADLTTKIRSVWRNRDDRYSELRSATTNTTKGDKIEMYQVGG